MSTEILSKPTSSVEDIGYLVGMVEQLADSDILLKDRDDVAELFWVVEHRVSDAGSELMTGIHGDDEEHVFALILTELRRLAGARALNEGLIAWDKTQDSGKVMKAVLFSLEEVLVDTLEADYEKRLDGSPMEKVKRVLAHNEVVNRIASVSVQSAATLATVAATGYFLKTSDASMTDFETLRRGGIFGVAMAMGVVAVSAAKKSLPRKVGSVLGSKVQTSSKTYALAQHLLRDSKGNLLPADALMEKYAERDLSALIPAVALHLLTSDMDKREDIAPVINKILDLCEISILESYGVDLEEPWYQQWASHLSTAEILNGFLYAYPE